jgi:SAM-dependent methyltransferase
MNLSGLYDGAYVENTYGADLTATFNRIVALPSATSDNYGRVKRIQKFTSKHLPDGRRNLLDIGAGTGVFPYAMKNVGWCCTALDPDSQACEHLREKVGVAVIQGDLNSVTGQSIGTFDLITLNKVIEHVEDPVSMLESAGKLLSRDGILYIEVPDGSAAARLSQDREEFYVEHLHAFSVTSLASSIERAGLWCMALSRIVEPSGKRTLYAFATNLDSCWQ